MMRVESTLVPAGPRRDAALSAAENMARGLGDEPLEADPGASALADHLAGTSSSPPTATPLGARDGLCWRLWRLWRIRRHEAGEPCRGPRSSLITRQRRSPRRAADRALVARAAQSRSDRHGGPGAARAHRARGNGARTRDAALDRARRNNPARVVAREAIL